MKARPKCAGCGRIRVTRITGQREYVTISFDGGKWHTGCWYGAAYGS